MQQSNLLELIPELDERYHKEGIDYRILGGAATAAMSKIMLLDAEQYTMSINGGNLPTIRENGSLRDLDILVMSSERQVLRAAGALALKEAKGKYAPAVFSFGSYDDYTYSSGRQFSEWTSSRLIDEQGNYYYGLYPFITQTDSAEEDINSYQPWRVNSAFGQWTSLAPPAQALAYQIRSIGGVRNRDIPKVQAINNASREFIDPEQYAREHLAGWLKFKTLLDFGRSCRIGAGMVNPFIDGIEYTPSQLAAFRSKSKLMHELEHQEWALALAQGSGKLGKFLEPLRRKIIDEH